MNRFLFLENKSMGGVSHLAIFHKKAEMRFLIYWLIRAHFTCCEILLIFRALLTFMLCVKKKAFQMCDHLLRFARSAICRFCCLTSYRGLL